MNKKDELFDEYEANCKMIDEQMNNLPEPEKYERISLLGVISTTMLALASGFIFLFLPKLLVLSVVASGVGLVNAVFAVACELKAHKSRKTSEKLEHQRTEEFNKLCEELDKIDAMEKAAADKQAQVVYETPTTYTEIRTKSKDDLQK